MIGPNLYKQLRARMRSVHRGVLLPLLLAITLPLVSCDSGGSNDSSSNKSPDWVGNWEATKGIDGPTDLTTFLKLTKDQFTIVAKSSDECGISEFDVRKWSEDNMTLGIPEGTLKLGFDVSSETLSMTVLESDDESSEGNKVTAVRIDGDPLEIADCPDPSPLNGDWEAKNITIDGREYSYVRLLSLAVEDGKVTGSVEARWTRGIGDPITHTGEVLGTVDGAEFDLTFNFDQIDSWTYEGQGFDEPPRLTGKMTRASGGSAEITLEPADIPLD